MSRLAVLLPAAIFAGSLSILAQTAPKPLNERELIRTIDSIGTGDPLTKQPLGIDDDKPKKDEKPLKKEKGPTEITAEEATFDNKTHQAVFIGNVVVKDPEFNVTCDRLTAVLKHEEKEPEEKPATPNKATPRPATPPPATKAEKKDKGGGLEKAIAEASGDRKVLITQERREEDGKVSINTGRARKVVYEAVTGDITLSGMPSVQQGINTCMALEESTVIILNREGRMRVVGPHKTVIKDTNSADSNR